MATYISKLPADIQEDIFRKSYEYTLEEIRGITLECKIFGPHHISERILKNKEVVRYSYYEPVGMQWTVVRPRHKVHLFTNSRKGNAIYNYATLGGFTRECCCNKPECQDCISRRERVWKDHFK